MPSAEHSCEVSSTASLQTHVPEGQPQPSRRHAHAQSKAAAAQALARLSVQCLPRLPAAQQIPQLCAIKHWPQAAQTLAWPQVRNTKHITSSRQPSASWPCPQPCARRYQAAPRSKLSAASCLWRRLQRATASGSWEAGLLPAAWRLPEQTAPAGRLPATSSCRSCVARRHHAALRSSSSAAFSSLAVDCSAAIASTREKPMSASFVTFSSSVAACERCAKFSTDTPQGQCWRGINALTSEQDVPMPRGPSCYLGRHASLRTCTSACRAGQRVARQTRTLQQVRRLLTRAGASRAGQIVATLWG